MKNLFSALTALVILAGASSAFAVKNVPVAKFENVSNYTTPVDWATEKPDTALSITLFGNGKLLVQTTPTASVSSKISNANLQRAKQLALQLSQAKITERISQIVCMAMAPAYRGQLSVSNANYEMVKVWLAPGCMYGTNLGPQNDFDKQAADALNTLLKTLAEEAKNTPAVKFGAKTYCTKDINEYGYASMCGCADEGFQYNEKIGQCVSK